MNAQDVVITVWLLATLITGIEIIGTQFGWCINTTPSVPVGLWHIHRSKEGMRRGQIVSVCPPNTQTIQLAKQRGYIPNGQCPGGYEPLLKPIAAIAGDTVNVTPEGISINGTIIRSSQAQKQDVSGRPLSRVPNGQYLVQRGSVWLISSGHADAFDSRYFGPVSTQNIEGVASPIWVRRTL